MEFLTHILLLHGALVLVFGLLCGIPYGLAILRERPEAVERAWRVAHSGLTMGGILLLAVAALLDHLVIGTEVKVLLVWSFIASGYGFAIALPYDGWARQRAGADARPPGRPLYAAGSALGTIGSLVGALCLLYGAVRTLLAAS